MTGKELRDKLTKTFKTVPEAKNWDVVITVKDKQWSQVNLRAKDGTRTNISNHEYIGPASQQTTESV